MKPSTLHPEALPEIEELRRLMQSLAMLDAIMSPEWESRYFSFNSEWAHGEQMGSMCNGSGDDWFALFLPAGVAIKGCAHEYELAGEPKFVELIRKVVPKQFDAFVNEPAFTMEWASFCLWRKTEDTRWTVASFLDVPNPDSDGSEFLLEILDGNPETYREFAEDYYERTVSTEAVKAVYAHAPLSRKIAAELNQEADWEELQKEAGEIGYAVDPKDRLTM